MPSVGSIEPDGTRNSCCATGLAFAEPEVSPPLAECELPQPPSTAISEAARTMQPLRRIPDDDTRRFTVAVLSQRTSEPVRDEPKRRPGYAPGRRWKLR